MPLKCCIPDCCAKGMTMHRFPNPNKYLEVMQKWLDVINLDNLRELDPPTLYKSKRICFAHFEAKFKSEGNPRLHKNAIPSINLPGNSQIFSPIQVNIEENVADNPTVEIYVTNVTASEGNSQIFSPIQVNIEENVADHPTVEIYVTNVTASEEKISSVNNNKRKLSKTYPEEKQIHELEKKLRLEKTRFRRSSNNFKRRLSERKKMTKSDYFKKLTEDLPSTAKKFFGLQCRMTNKKPKGRRFSLEEKTLALLLLKRSPKGYDLLKKKFTLPSRKTLNHLLKTINLKPGVNKKMMLNLKSQVQKLPKTYRICSLVFDEMRIAPSLKYNSNSDEIEGFVDNGQQRKPTFSDHAIVFMARGLVKQWKQPVSFAFCEGSTKAAELQVMLKQIIQELQEIGLIVICTICDQAKGNQTAINNLIEDTVRIYRSEEKEMRGTYFEVDGHMIVPLFDGPHLLKCVRNNLLKYNLKYKMNNINYEAKWEHLVELFEDDQKEITDLRALPKLDKRHINPNSREKMKVNLCAQVFSQRVAASLRSYAKREPAREELINGTAKLFVFFDKLFDSVNGGKISIKAGKELRGPFKRGSGHAEFWNLSLKFLESMVYVDPGNSKKTFRPDCLKNWAKTIRGFQFICKKLQEEYKIKFIILRNFNQDPLEKFFGSIRSHGLRNTNPTSPSFTAAYKTLIVNNFMSPHSAGANCEMDLSEGALSTLGALLNDEVVDEGEEVEEASEEIYIENINLNEPQSCCGYILKNLKKYIYKGCKECKTDLEAVKVGFQHNLIHERDYYENKELLKYPSFSAAKCFIHIKKITYEYLSKYAVLNCFLKNITDKCLKEIDFTFVTCQKHKEHIIFKMVEKTATLVIYGYINEINKILLGKNVPNKESAGTDSLKTLAIAKREKIRKFKLALQKK